MSEMRKIYADVIKKVWEDEDFKKRLTSDPKSTLKKDFGVDIPSDVELRVLMSEPKLQYLVVPPNPSGEMTQISEEEILGIAAGGNSFMFTQCCLATQYQGGSTCPPLCGHP